MAFDIKACTSKIYITVQNRIYINLMPLTKVSLAPNNVNLLIC